MRRMAGGARPASASRSNSSCSEKLEAPVKRLLQGAAIDEIAGREAVDDFSALAYFTRFARGAQ
ncbi:hypothetical protein [Streptomyces sp. NBC_00209]|uniref:hypothetical protein n=1 Tax=Streptomyces sp. NBC_00209 TaxID=2975682 RepID=UPI003253BCB4